jgi:hypothetical protein
VSQILVVVADLVRCSWQTLQLVLLAAQGMRTDGIPPNAHSANTTAPNRGGMQVARIPLEYGVPRTHLRPAWSPAAQVGGECGQAPYMSRVQVVVPH